MKLRRLKHKTPKCFGVHSRIVDGVGVKPADAGGRSVGSKQICPGEYPRLTRHRSLRELAEAAEHYNE